MRAQWIKPGLGGVLLAASLFLSVNAEARPSLTGSVDRQAVAVGQTLTYTLRLEVDNKGTVERLDRPAFKGFSVLGQSKGTEFSSSGGRTRLSYTFSFQIKALKEGVTIITPAKAVVGGKALEGNPVTVKVTPRGTAPPAPTASGAGDVVFALVEVSEREPYVGSQVQVAYKLFLNERKVGPFGAELQAMVEPSFDGFWIEEVESRENRLGTSEVIGGERYKAQTLKSLAVFPLESGEITIAPMELEVGVSSRRSMRRQATKVVTKPVVMKVKPLPKGAPEGFDASNVGQYRFRVVVDKKKVAVGEPLTVRLEVAGSGMVRRVKLPELGAIEGARMLEPVYDRTAKASGKLMGGIKAAEIVVTPTKEGVLRLPELKFHFFDPIEDKYKTETARAKAVRVIGRSTELEKEEALIAREEADQPEAVQIARKPLGALRPIGDGGGDPPRASALGAPWFVIGMLGPPLGLFGWWLVGFVRRRREEGGEERHRQSAPERAQEALEAARAASRSEEGQGQAVGAIASALTGYLSERLELPPGAISARRLKERLGELGVEESVIRELLEIRRQCDEARFSPLPVGGALALADRAMSVFEALRRAL